MKKVISFSLWGNNPTYNIGTIRNVQDAYTMYPDFECWVYIHTESVPQTTVDILKQYSNTKIIMKNGDISNENCKPRMWRFESIDDPDVEIMISREEVSRTIYNSTNDIYYMHYKNTNSNKFNWDEFTSDITVVSKEELYTILNNIFV